MMLNDTELRLSFWRDGSTQAESFAAAVLRMSGYEEIDPQSPQGGPDGKKDILCRKGGITWVGAVYFPSGPVGFTAIKKKYGADLNGAPANRKGFAFVTNQKLTPAQRKNLTAMAQAAGKEVYIVHLQRLVNLMNSAPGYGVRIQYLRIPMTIEEQLSWSVESDSQTAKALAANTRELLALRTSIDRMDMGQSRIKRTLDLALAANAPTPDLISVSSFERKDEFVAVSARLAPEVILLFHRLTCFDLPSRNVGRLRTEQVWLGGQDGEGVTGMQPLAPANLASSLESLCREWNDAYSKLRSREEKLNAIARFHARLLLIHPFSDGNGRAARALMMQQCLDLFGRADMTLLKKGPEYYYGLKAADNGDSDVLAALIDPVVRG